jgi:hypothetical protein
MIEYEARATRLHVIPKGAELFNGNGFTVALDDEGAGEFVIIAGNGERTNGFAVDPKSWPPLRDAIDLMIRECREHESE